MKLYLAAIGRIDRSEDQRRDFYLYIDEFQGFVATEGLDDILSEARKYRLCLTLAHQYLGQLEEGLRKAIFGNVGTTIVFPVGPENGERLEREFHPPFNQQDLVDQPGHHIYLKLAIDGRTSRPFSACTLPPFQGLRSQGKRDLLVRRSRERYAAGSGRTCAEGKTPALEESARSRPGQRTLL